MGWKGEDGGPEAEEGKRNCPGRGCLDLPPSSRNISFKNLKVPAHHGAPKVPHTGEPVKLGGLQMLLP